MTRPEGADCVGVLEVVLDKHPRVSRGVLSRQAALDGGVEGVLRSAVDEIHTLVVTGDPSTNIVREVGVTHMNIGVKDGRKAVSGWFVAVTTNGVKTQSTFPVDEGGRDAVHARAVESGPVGYFHAGLGLEVERGDQGNRDLVDGYGFVVKGEFERLADRLEVVVGHFPLGKVDLLSPR